MTIIERACTDLHSYILQEIQSISILSILLYITFQSAYHLLFCQNLYMWSEKGTYFVDLNAHVVAAVISSHMEHLTGTSKIHMTWPKNRLISKYFSSCIILAEIIAIEVA